MDNLFASRVGRSASENEQVSRDSWRHTAGKSGYETSFKGFRENNDDYYVSKKNQDDDDGSKRTFFPITEEWQKEKAAQFKIKVVKSIDRRGSVKNFFDKTAPKETIRVEGDGNCFFRAISTCIIGSENEHMRIRELITKHVEDNPEMYRTFLQSRGGMNQYLTSMRRPREWATDVEILAAATLLKTVIEVYFPCRVKGNIEFRWQTFKPLTHPDITYPAIYLSNKNDHFDPVLDVYDEVVENEGTKNSTESDRTRRDSSTKHSESVLNSHDPSVYSTPFSSRSSHDSRRNSDSIRKEHAHNSMSHPSSHESSFYRIHGLPNVDSSSRRNFSRSTHHNVSEF